MIDGPITAAVPSASARRGERPKTLEITWRSYRDHAEIPPRSCGDRAESAPAKRGNLSRSGRSTSTALTCHQRVIKGSSKGHQRDDQRSRQEAIHASSGGHPGVIRKPSRSHQGAIKESSGSHQRVITEPSTGHRGAIEGGRDARRRLHSHCPVLRRRCRRRLTGRASRSGLPQIAAPGLCQVGVESMLRTSRSGYPQPHQLFARRGR